AAFFPLPAPSAGPKPRPPICAGTCDDVGSRKRSTQPTCCPSRLLRVTLLVRKLFLSVVICVVTAFLVGGQQAEAQLGTGDVRVPVFWDPRRRPEKPDLSRGSAIRFLTEIDYPPFNFAGPDGNPQGFNVDLARMMCEELKLACTIQMRRFETLLAALNENRGDGVIASIAVTPEMRAKVDFTDPYYRTPGRFVARRDL